MPDLADGTQVVGGLSAAKIDALEGAAGGLILGSGMAAVTAALRGLDRSWEDTAFIAMFSATDRLVSSDCSWCTTPMCSRCWQRPQAREGRPERSGRSGESLLCARCGCASPAGLLGLLALGV